MKLSRFVLLIFAVCLLSACKIRIIVSDGGSVGTESGTFTCPAGSTCDIDVVDFFFDETFVATPLNGYEFRFWRRADRRFCGEDTNPCRLFTVGWNAFENLAIVMEEFFASPDEVFFLQPVFRSTGRISLPLNQANVQGRWTGQADIMTPNFPDISCRWDLEVNIQDAQAQIFASLSFDNTPIDCESFQSLGSVSFRNNGTEMRVDITQNNTDLLGPALLVFSVGNDGQLTSVENYVFDGIDIVQTTTFERP